MLDGNEPELLKSEQIASRLGIHFAMVLGALLRSEIKPIGIIKYREGGWCPYWSETQLPEIKQALREYLNL